MEGCTHTPCASDIKDLLSHVVVDLTTAPVKAYAVLDRFLVFSGVRFEHYLCEYRIKNAWENLATSPRVHREQLVRDPRL